MTREPEYTDADREALYALYQDDLERCPDCGQPMDVCAQIDVDYYPQRRICWSSAAREVANRRWTKRTEDAQPDEAGYLPGDGVTVWMAREDLKPDEDWLTD